MSWSQYAISQAVIVKQNGLLGSCLPHGTIRHHRTSLRNQTKDGACMLMILMPIEPTNDLKYPTTQNPNYEVENNT